MDTQTIISAIQDDLRTIPGIMAAPRVLPDGQGNFPFIIAYPGSASYGGGTSDTLRHLESFIVELHCARKHLPRDYEQALRFCRIVPETIADTLIENSLAFDGITSSGLIPMSWGDAATIGFRWTVNDVKTIA